MELSQNKPKFEVGDVVHHFGDEYQVLKVRRHAYLDLFEVEVMSVSSRLVQGYHSENIFQFKRKAGERIIVR